MESLLRYLMQNPDQAGGGATSEADSKQQFKYPYAACEVGIPGVGFTPSNCSHAISAARGFVAATIHRFARIVCLLKSSTSTGVVPTQMATARDG